MKVKVIIMTSAIMMILLDACMYSLPHRCPRAVPCGVCRAVAGRAVWAVPCGPCRACHAPLLDVSRRLAAFDVAACTCVQIEMKMGRQVHGPAHPQVGRVRRGRIPRRPDADDCGLRNLDLGLTWQCAGTISNHTPTPHTHSHPHPHPRPRPHPHPHSHPRPRPKSNPHPNWKLDDCRLRAPWRALGLG